MSCTRLARRSNLQSCIHWSWRLLSGRRLRPSQEAHYAPFSIHQSWKHGSGFDIGSTEHTTARLGPGEMPHPQYPERASFSRNANVKISIAQTERRSHTGPFSQTCKPQTAKMAQASPQDRSPNANSHVTPPMTHSSAFVTLYPRPHYPIPSNFYDPAPQDPTLLPHTPELDPIPQALVMHFIAARTDFTTEHCPASPGSDEIYLVMVSWRDNLHDR